MKLSAAARYQTPDASELAAQWLSNLVAIAAEKQGIKDSDAAGKLIKDTAQQLGVPPEALGGLAGRTENGDLVYIHHQIGSGSRFVGAVQAAGNGKTRVYTGCFRGTDEDFAAKVAEKYPSGEIANQYAGFTAAFTECFARGKTMPKLNEAVYGRVRSWHVRNTRNFG